ncbi:MAG: hypothetical protein OFPII_34820 [Osedax symbiont Rs1]|nr:MAG: hypothetical protein OFPII_34820 [Osedax symbiont Rs1]
MFDNINVNAKLWILLSIALLGAVILQTFSSYQMKSNLIEGRKHELQNLVAGAISISSHYYALRSELGEEQAKSAALDAIKALRYNNNKGYFWINDKNLTLLMHPLKPQKEGKNMRDAQDGNGQYHWRAMLKVVNQQGAGFVNYSYKGPQFDEPAAKLSYVKAFKPWGWIVGTGIYINDIDEIYMRTVYKIMMIFAAILVVISVFSAFIARSITRPLTVIVDNMQVAATGDLLSHQVLAKRGDEIGTLNESFMHMISTIVSLVEHSRENADKVNRVAGDSFVITEQTDSGLKQQYTETDALASAVEELGMTLKEVAINTSQTTQLTNETSLEIENSNNLMERTLHAIDRVSSEVESGCEAILQLEKGIKKIDIILNVIGGISEQTNLLALNAAIEAARAGEAGRGFAVVADEVRLLAQRTKDSTSEIKTMTENLQAEALRAVSVMKSSSEQAQQCVEFSSETGISLQLATKKISDVRDRIEHVSETVTQQEAVIREVGHSVASIRTIAQQTSEGTTILATNGGILESLTAATRKLLLSYKI